MTETAPATFFAGDRVQLVRPVPGRPVLKPGLVGRVLVGDESAPAEWGMVSVEFADLGNHGTWLLHRRLLALIERQATAALEDDAGD